MVDEHASSDAIELAIEAIEDHVKELGQEQGVDVQAAVQKLEDLEEAAEEASAE